ncbi:DUF6090 family protein [Croceivirga thetidis]|uniref:Uncharacterized protein n=1 Tax=Croceivirga thetidis TaxID=2721623 RepID=A0ABX1GPG8_9FLAO|nr:DUF6090 family protein [Croceivirga thetidis]NKI30936.1 hypothetical protein [Croceivirga thetidis]
MIKFFRRIRQKLLAENRFSKYLFYAIGEIILVMIGILLALQVNNWNQDRINDKKEIEILKALKTDVEINLGQFDHYKNLVGVKTDVLVKILNGTYDTLKYIEVNGDSINELFVTRFEYDLTIQDLTIKETFSNGNNALIKSDELRKEIFNYYNLIDDRRGAMKTGRSNWTALLSGLIPGELYETGINEDSTDELSPIVPKVVIQKLKTDLEVLRPAINAEIQYSSRAYRNLNQLKKRANNLIQQLDQEIKSKSND